MLVSPAKWVFVVRKWTSGYNNRISIYTKSKKALNSDLDMTYIPLSFNRGLPPSTHVAAPLYMKKKW